MNLVGTFYRRKKASEKRVNWKQGLAVSVKCTNILQWFHSWKTIMLTTITLWLSVIFVLILIVTTLWHRMGKPFYGRFIALNDASCSVWKQRRLGNNESHKTGRAYPEIEIRSLYFQPTTAILRHSCFFLWWLRYDLSHNT